MYYFSGAEYDSPNNVLGAAEIVGGAGGLLFYQVERMITIDFKTRLQHR